VLARLARAGKIEVHQIDLNWPDAVSGLVTGAQANGEKIAVLDFSNAWQENHVGKQALAKIFDKVSLVSSPAAALMGTSIEYLGPEFSESHLFRMWGYFALPLKQLTQRTPDKLREIFMALKLTKPAVFIEDPCQKSALK
jgi:hypothetical protein